MTELDVQIRRSLFAHFRRYNNRSTRIRITSSRRIKLKHNIITRGKLIDSPLLSTFIFYSVLSCRFESWLNIARPSKAICHIVLLSRTVQTSPEAAASTLVSCLSLFQPIFIPHPRIVTSLCSRLVESKRKVRTDKVKCTRTKKSNRWTSWQAKE